jgi:thymidine kinase
MAKLFFIYSAMNAGKTTNLLQVAYNYEEKGMRAYLMTAHVDERAGVGYIGSRIGLKRQAAMYTPLDNLFMHVQSLHRKDLLHCILIDEAQFLTKVQVDQLAEIVDRLNIPVMCYGLRTDFQGGLFSGSQQLLAVADEIKEIKTICWCGKKATMVLRTDFDGTVCTAGDQVQIGGNESYHSVCRKHWIEKNPLSAIFHSD